MKLFDLLQIKYNQFERGINDYLSKFLSSKNTSYGNNTIFGQLLTVLNATVQNIMLYIEDSLVEQNKYTAQRKKSIYGLAAQSGYNPSLGKASGVQLRLNYIPNNVNNLNVIIRDKEVLTCTQNGMLYNIILPQEAVIISPDNNYCDLYAVQGRFESQTFVSIGGEYYTQNFNFLGNLDMDYLTVKINDELWEKSEGFYDMDPDGKQWTCKISPISGIDLIFGNNQHGRALKDGDVINISYLIHDGEAGNMDVNENTYFLFNNLLQDISGEEVDGNAVFNLTFNSKDAIIAGTNSESISQVRQMIGLNSRSLVLASPENYKSIINKFSFCGYNRTWSEKGSMVVNSLIMKNYKLLLNEDKTYFDLNEQDFKLTDQQKNSIINSIEKTGNQLAGVTYKIFDPELCKYALYIYLKLKSGNHDKNYITSKIRNLIAEFFTDINSDIFIPKSDIIQLIKNNISEIDGVDLYFLSELNETAIQTGQYIETQYNYDQVTNSYKKKVISHYLYPGENPNLGLDEHGNIYLQSDVHFPVLMGGWDYINSNGDEVSIIDPLIIIYE